MNATWRRPTCKEGQAVEQNLKAEAENPSGTPNTASPLSAVSEAGLEAPPSQAYSSAAAG